MKVRQRYAIGIRMVRFFLIFGVLTLLASFAGAIHPAGDSLAVFRPQLAFALLVCGTLYWALRRRWVGCFAMVVALCGGMSVWPGLLRQHQTLAGGMGPDAIRIYQKNMSFRLKDVTLLAEDIRASGVTHVTLQEVDAENEAIFQSLKDQFPTQILCREKRAIGGMAVLSAWPRTEAPIICAWGFVAVEVQGPVGPLWIASVHLYWPYPHDQARQVKSILPKLQRMTGNIVIGGDFNMVSYASATRRIQDAARVNPMPAQFNSFPRFGTAFPLAIDHVWAKQVLNVTKRPLFGSDHLGLIAEVHVR